MAEGQAGQLSQALRWGPWHIGDPAVLLESILGQVEAEQRKQVMAMYLDTVTATLEANLKLVQGMRSMMAPAKK